MNDESPKKSGLSAAVVRDDEEHYVVLPCGVSEFGGFVAGLLGKPQELKGIVEGAFDVEYQDIANIFHLVHDRVMAQNEGTMTHFSITVHYTNGTSITHNDVSKFKAYHPTDNCFPHEVVLLFTYLLNFPNSTYPEKQTIEVALITGSNRSTRSHRHYADGGFEYNIHYTNRTWATDIGSLLKNHGHTFIEKTSKVRRFMRSYNDDILSFIMVLVMTAVLVSWTMLAYDVASQFSAADTISGQDFGDGMRFFAGSMAVIFILGMWFVLIQRFTEYHIYPPLGSHIVLVDRDARRREKLRKSALWRWLAVFGGWVFSVLAGLLANYLNHSGYFLPG